jgi:oligoribonuclease
MDKGKVMTSKLNLIWIDLEMTGLDPIRDKVIEIATIVTSPNLDVLAEGPVFAIKQNKETMDGMDDWNTKQHTKSGLLNRVLNSQVDELEASLKTIDFLSDYVKKGCSPMCGNSICQDRRFLARYMPNLESYFHYRHIDVSTLKELARRWSPELLKKAENKQSKHLALDDIRDSISELKYYRQHFIKEKI